MWVDKDGKPYQGGGIVIDNKRYWFPTPEQFEAAGYHEYVPPPPEPVDMTEFNNACTQFRAVCAQIEQAAGLEGFKGGFDEMPKFQQSPIYSTIPGLQLAMAWSAINEFCKYEGEKVGFGQPEWWYECWRQVEPEPTPEPEPEEEEPAENEPTEEPVENPSEDNPAAEATPEEPVNTEEEKTAIEKNQPEKLIEEPSPAEAPADPSNIPATTEQVSEPEDVTDNPEQTEDITSDTTQVEEFKE